jgi:NADH-quinone oxidoreductase subunit N
MNLYELNWGLMAPEFTITTVVLLLIFADLFLSKTFNRVYLGWVAVIGILLAMFFTMQQMQLPEAEYLLNNTYRVDSFGSLFKMIFLLGTLTVFLMSIGTVKKDGVENEGEYYYLLLTAVLGAMVMASSADLITLYIGLELLSFSTYILVALRKKYHKSNESAFKFVITGSVSSAIFIYGASYIYGLTGSTNLFEIAERLPMAFHSGYDFFAYFGFILMFIGLSYKITIVPSYMWAPDVYEGAPTPITAFLSVVSKAAGFAIIIRVFLTVFGLLATDVTIVNGVEQYRFFLYDEIIIIFAVLAGLTMFVGNVIALLQTNVKRLLAYSSIAQAGYIFVPLSTLIGIEFIDLSITNIMFYLIAYLIMNLGAFAVVTVVTRDSGHDDITSFRGLYHRSPLLAIAMTFFLLSLAGLPISIGFIAKLNIFISAIVVNSFVLAGIIVVTSIISYFYYFRIVKQMYMRPGTTEAKMPIGKTVQVLVLVLFLLTFLLGLFPNVVYDFLNNNFIFTDIFEVGKGFDW